MKTYQIVAPSAAPGQPSPRYFTQNVSDLARAPVGSVIVVQQMTDDEFNAIVVTTNSAKFFA